jgi:hypothetical protein
MRFTKANGKGGLKKVLTFTGHPCHLQGWLEKGIDIYWADFWCIKFGYHPVEIFGNAFYQGCFDEERAA